MHADSTHPVSPPGRLLRRLRDETGGNVLMVFALALIPLMIIWFGFGILPKLLVVALVLALRARVARVPAAAALAYRAMLLVLAVSIPVGIVLSHLRS